MTQKKPINYTIIFDNVRLEDEDVQQGYSGPNSIFGGFAGSSGEQDISEPTELGEAFRELNKDRLDHSTRMSDIDLRTRLHNNEIHGILTIDTLVGFKVLPLSCMQFTLRAKRLKVSENGEGRKEMVAIATDNIEKTKQSRTQKFFSGLGFGNKGDGVK